MSLVLDFQKINCQKYNFQFPLCLNKFPKASKYLSVLLIGIWKVWRLISDLSCENSVNLYVISLLLTEQGKFRGLLIFKLFII